MGPRDERYTPGWVLDPFRVFAGTGFTDLAAPRSNPTKAPVYVCKSGVYAGADRVDPRHALALPWTELPGPFWLNPPFSEMRIWVERVLRYVPQIELCLLTTTDHTTRWWKSMRGIVAARCILEHRLKCEGPDGKTYEVARSATVHYFGGNARLFGTCFKNVGEIWPCKHEKR